MKPFSRPAGSCWGSCRPRSSRPKGSCGPSLCLNSRIEGNRSLVAHSSGLASFGKRHHADVDLAELAASTALLLVAIACLRPWPGPSRDRGSSAPWCRLPPCRGACRRSWITSRVQLAHAGHHQFLGLGVAIQAEGVVFLVDLVQRARQTRPFVAAALRQSRPGRPWAWGTTIGRQRPPRPRQSCPSGVLRLLARATM